MVSPTGVRVEWSQPPGGAAVTGYVVFFYDGSVTRNKSIPSTSTEIIVSSATLIYVICDKLGKTVGSEATRLTTLQRGKQVM